MSNVTGIARHQLVGDDGQPLPFEMIVRLYETALESLAETVQRCNVLEAVVTGQVQANNSLGAKDANRDVLLEAQLNDHNTTVQDMGAEIDRLRALCGKHGIDPGGG